MIETKLILVEGVPGSGKSTAATNLQTIISDCGIPCHCFLEWDKNNPIHLGPSADLATIISSTRSRQQHTQQQWSHLAHLAQQQDTIHIIDGRFWQTDSMYLFLSGSTQEAIFDHNANVITAIETLNPVLIYLAPHNITQLHQQIAHQRNQAWAKAGRDGSWEEWGNQIYEQQRWFTSRGFDSQAMPQFFNEWVTIADQLYDRFPFRKIRLCDPQLDWEQTMIRIQDFLGLNDGAL